MAWVVLVKKLDVSNTSDHVFDSLARLPCVFLINKQKNFQVIYGFIAIAALS